MDGVRRETVREDGQEGWRYRMWQRFRLTCAAVHGKTKRRVATVHRQPRETREERAPEAHERSAHSLDCCRKHPNDPEVLELNREPGRGTSPAVSEQLWREDDRKHGAMAREVHGDEGRVNHAAGEKTKSSFLLRRIKPSRMRISHSAVSRKGQAYSEPAAAGRPNDRPTG